MPIDLTKLVAPPGYAAYDWQSSAPKESWGPRPPIGRSPDLDRVLALPRRPIELDGTDRAEAIIDMMTDRYSLHNTNCVCASKYTDRWDAEGCITRLRLVQALALREIGICGGLLGPIGTGHGKTLIDLLAPLAFAHHAQDMDILCVLLVPPGLIEQLIADYEYIGQHFKMPSLVIQGSDYSRIIPGMPRLQVMPYSRLQRSEATSWLKTVKPHALIIDECHKLRNPDTATTSRVINYMGQYSAVRAVAMSGSMTSKSIRDYAHLASMALHDASPLPRDPETVKDWARGIDPGLNPADPGPLLDGLIATGCCLPGESFRTGIRRRLMESLGVVSTSTPSVDCALDIRERVPTYPIPPQITMLIGQALGGVRPDGEELVTAMQMVACAIEIACGFHYKWIFPKHKFPEDEQLVNEWRDVRKEWHKELRAKLRRREEHLDSPQLCEFAAQRALGIRTRRKGLPEWTSLIYPEWHKIKNLVKYDSEAVRLNDYLVRDAVDWVHSRKGILWYQHDAFGKWVAEMAGLPLYGGGKEAKLALLGSRARGIQGETGDRSVICSLRAHGTGTNGLQYHFSEMLFGSPPADPSAWEQPIARLHRPHQKASCVSAEFYMHTKELRKHVTAALIASAYVQDTGFGAQKIRMGIPMDVIAELEQPEKDDGEE